MCTDYMRRYKEEEKLWERGVLMSISIHTFFVLLNFRFSFLIETPYFPSLRPPPLPSYNGLKSVLIGHLHFKLQAFS